WRGLSWSRLSRIADGSDRRLLDCWPRAWAAKRSREKSRRGNPPKELRGGAGTSGGQELSARPERGGPDADTDRARPAGERAAHGRGPPRPSRSSSSLL